MKIEVLLNQIVFGDLQRAKKSRKTQTVFLESKAEYLIPPKTKSSGRCDAGFIYRKFIDFFLQKKVIYVNELPGAVDRVYLRAAGAQDRLG